MIILLDLHAVQVRFEEIAQSRQTARPSDGRLENPELRTTLQRQLELANLSQIEIRSPIVLHCSANPQGDPSNTPHSDLPDAEL